MKTLRLFLWPLLAFLLTAIAPAQPVSASDSLYLEDFRQGVSQSVAVIWLKPDGTFVTLSNDSRSTSNGIATPLGAAVTGTGTYTYSASPADQTATLVLGSTTRKLVFTTTTAGHLDKPTLPAGVFELLGRGAVNPRANVALRGKVQGGAGPIAGLVLQSTQWVLLRAVGPGLAKFGVASPASSPTFTLTSNGSTVFTKAGWDTADHGLETAFNLVGAFPLDRGSNDAALLVRLQGGSHTVQALSTGTEGDVLIEVYYLPFSY
jgi:hypothetical protein